MNFTINQISDVSNTPYNSVKLWGKGNDSELSSNGLGIEGVCVLQQE